MGRNYDRWEAMRLATGDHDAIEEGWGSGNSKGDNSWDVVVLYSRLDMDETYCGRDDTCDSKVSMQILFLISVPYR